MRRAVFASVALLAAFGTTAVAQEVAKPAAGNGAATTPAIVITPETTPKDLARAAFLAQGRFDRLQAFSAGPAADDADREKQARQRIQRGQ